MQHKQDITQATAELPPHKHKQKPQAQSKFYQTLPTQNKLSKTQQKIRSSALVNKILTQGKWKVLHPRKRYKSTINTFFQPTICSQQSKTKTEKVDRSLENSRMSKIVTEVYKTINKNSNSGSKIRKSESAINQSYTQNSRKAHISMSGLINHNFLSVKSKNRLGLAPEAAELSMEQSITETKTRAEASAVRTRKIHLKTDPSIQQPQLQDSIMDDYKPIKTSKFLTNILNHKRRSQVVYGQTFQQYESVLKMNKELNNIDESLQIFGEIKNMRAAKISPQPRRIPKKREKNFRKEEKNFEGRRRPSNNRGSIIQTIQ